MFKGILSARGSVILFADADGATKFKDLEKLDDSLKNILGCKLFFKSWYKIKSIEFL